jgi:polysaccharide export outer membrane protein
MKGPPTHMTTKKMNAKTDANKHAPGDDNCTNTWFGRIRELVRTSAPHRRRWATGMLWASVLLVFGAFLGCETTNHPPVPPEAYLSKPNNSLAPGDEIIVIFSGAPELNTKQKIQPNGKVSLPTIGEVAAAGKSVSSLQQQLTSLYQPHLQDSRVVISVAGIAAGVYVSGAVQRPGKIPLDRSMTALEAVMEAGGFTQLANPSQVFIVRVQGGKSRQYVLNLKDALHNTESTPFYVRAYDVIYVKERVW